MSMKIHKDSQRWVVQNASISGSVKNECDLLVMNKKIPERLKLRKSVSNNAERIKYGSKSKSGNTK